MAEVIELGSLYFNDKAVSIGAKYNGERIRFGDRVPGKGIPFLKWRDIYVADRCVCTGISWSDLHEYGFVFGWPVKIDGASYLCRLLKTGAEKDVPNEWDVLLDDLGEDDSLWHWEQQYFWGQETPSKWPSYRSVRGSLSARNWARSIATNRLDYIGFRPILEPMPPELQVSDALVGRKIKAIGPNGVFTGCLISYDGYDLELMSDDPIPENCLWAKKAKETIFIDREAIAYLCEEE